MIKRLLPWMLIPLGLLYGASLVKLSQLRAPTSQTPSILLSLGNGSVAQGKIAGMTVDGSNNIILPAQTNSLPAISVFHVSSTTLNAFPIPTGKTLCFVTNNIPMALMEDYTIVNGSVIFNNPPVLDDIVQLLCF